MLSAKWILPLVIPLVLQPLVSSHPHLAGLLLSLFCARSSLAPWPSSPSILPFSGHCLLSGCGILRAIRTLTSLGLHSVKEKSLLPQQGFWIGFSCIPYLVHSCLFQWDVPCEGKVFPCCLFYCLFHVSLCYTKDF